MSPIELTLGDGSVVAGADLDDAFDNLAKMKGNTSTGQREPSARFLRPASPYPHARARRRKRVEGEGERGLPRTQTLGEL
jgi:hypothetical protein